MSARSRIAPSIRSRHAASIAAGPLAGVALLAFAGVVGPVPLSAQIDADRLATELAVLADDSMAGRRVGTPGGAAARRFLVERLTSIGLEVRETPFEGRDGARGVNVEVRIPGTGGDLPELVLTAHYDHLGVRDGEIFNGADDNASGTVAVLEIVRQLRRAPLRHPVTAVLFDGEEGGLRGARAWVATRREAGSLDQVGLNVNLDMVSRSDEELWVSGTHQHPELRPVLESVEPARGVVLRFGHDTPEDRGADNWVSASDHGAFHEVGIPFLYFGVEDHPDYHRPTDDADRVDPVWYAASVETIFRALRALDEALAAR